MDFLSLLGPLLSIGSGLLGAVFGNQTTDSKDENVVTGGTQLDHTLQNTTQATNQTDNKTTNQDTNQNTNQNSNQTVTGTTTNTGTTGTNQNNITSNNQTNNENITGITSRLDATTTSLLSRQVQDILRGGDPTSNTLNSQVNSLSSGPNAFDPNAYVSGIMTAANSTAYRGQKRAINQISANTGGNESTNSAAALLGADIRDQTANSLAGIRAQASADSQNIVNQRASTVGNLTGQLDQHTKSLLDSLLNAQATSSQATAGTVANTGTENITGNTNTNNTGTTGQNTVDTSTGSSTEHIGSSISDILSQNVLTNTTQDNSQIATGNQTTVTGVNESKNNWQDFFTNFAKIFSTNFHTAAS